MDKSDTVSESSLNRSHINDICLAASKMHGAERRAFIAEMTSECCDGNVRKSGIVFGWGRETIGKGLGEKRTGIICLGEQSAKGGRIRWEEKEAEAAEELRRLSKANSQQDPTFRSTVKQGLSTTRTIFQIYPERLDNSEIFQMGIS